MREVNKKDLDIYSVFWLFQVVFPGYNLRTADYFDCAFFQRHELKQIFCHEPMTDKFYFECRFVFEYMMAEEK